MTNDINVKELHQRLQEGDRDFVLIDVREPYEHDEFNIGGDLIPLGDLVARVNEIDAESDTEIIVYCRTGRRSAMAQQLLQQFGFENVRNLEGGVVEWQSEGLG